MERTNKKPEIIVFAGPNGSGKSTLTELLRPPLEYINADEIRKNLKCTDLEAAQTAEKQRENCVENGKEFCFETVLSTRRNLELLKRAKERGYFIRCYYVLTADPQINLWRVRSRVEAGGHDVPEDKIVTRYYKALELLKELIWVCDICHIYDNSGENPFRIVKKRKEKLYYDVCDAWSLEKIEKLTGLCGFEKKELNASDGKGVYQYPHPFSESLFVRENTVPYVSGQFKEERSGEWVEGLLAGKREDIFEFLCMKGEPLPKEVIDQINEEKDLRRLSHLLRIAAYAERLQDFYQETAEL